ncbi:uncharacterized protein RCC_06525 [Ramularia collo-cygni]|uniref:AA1-like domain-containing protein n=1 Tax=Ramularia collo-cygni TaxID=112498 RepID=A0A2D3V7D4_9PEZI|nr:uncharacterized protein RCC_06525 [Ramularia collo-cygni]CZT20667.1 uncharacterized protein RCC_06525 [Ramularia collo-cygni]
MFNLQATVAIMASLAMTTSAAVPYLHIENLSVADIRVPSESHSVKFVVSNPGAVYEQGGQLPYPVEIACYKSAEDFKLEVNKYYIYKNSVLNNSTITVLEDNGGYYCSTGAQSTRCDLPGSDGINSTYAITYGPVAQQPVPLC